MIALLLGLGGCAKREPPSGGPPDLEPPRLLESSPDSGRAGVPITTSLSLTFSEGMEPRSTGEAVALAPRVEIKRRLWHGRTLTLTPAAPLEPHRTYTLFVGGTARDRHGNSMGTGSTVVFSTADTFPPGRIEGEIEARGLAANTVALWCYSTGHFPDSTAQDFDALGLADVHGAFRVDGLAVPGAYRLWSFVDQNGNRSFEPDIDILSPIDTTLALSLAHPVASGLHVLVVNPRAPGRVQGAVLDSLPDSLGVLRVIAVAETDSSRRVMAETDPEARFELRLDPGSWWLRAFRDLDRSRSWQPELEPASERVRLVVQAGSEQAGFVLRIRPVGVAK